jgi:hypothetical protein
MLSFSISARGFPLVFLAAGAFFCFFALGGVRDRILALPSRLESSSSVSGFGRFFAAGLLVNLGCVVFFTAGFAAAAFFAGALALGFCIWSD